MSLLDFVVDAERTRHRTRTTREGGRAVVLIVCLFWFVVVLGDTVEVVQSETEFQNVAGSGQQRIVASSLNFIYLAYIEERSPRLYAQDNQFTQWSTRTPLVRAFPAAAHPKSKINEGADRFVSF